MKSATIYVVYTISMLYKLNKYSSWKKDMLLGVNELVLYCVPVALRWEEWGQAARGQVSSS
jgi:hypothetical protein